MNVRKESIIAFLLSLFLFILIIVIPSRVIACCQDSDCGGNNACVSIPPNCGAPKVTGEGNCKSNYETCSGSEQSSACVSGECFYDGAHKIVSLCEIPADFLGAPGKKLIVVGLQVLNGTKDTPVNERTFGFLHLLAERKSLSNLSKFDTTTPGLYRNIDSEKTEKLWISHGYQWAVNLLKSPEQAKIIEEIDQSLIHDRTITPNMEKEFFVAAVP